MLDSERNATQAFRYVQNIRIGFSLFDLAMAQMPD